MTIETGDLLLRHILLVLLLGVSPNLRAADPWHMPSQSWTQQDIDRLLSDSPWALQVDATMDDPADAPDGAASALPTGTEAGLPSNAKMGGTQRWDGGIGKNRMGHLATIPVVVRWDSAAVVRQALAQKHDAVLAALNAEAKESFIVTVIGLLPSNQVKSQSTLSHQSSSDEGGAVKTAEETLEWFMSNSRLLLKGQPALQPKNVKIDPATGAVRVFFSRSDALLSHKRDVFFVTRFGTMNVQAKFRTKDMVLDGQPDL